MYEPSYIKSIPFTGGQVELAGDQDEFDTLTASYEETPMGGMLVTEWQPDEEQRQRILNGDSIYLGVLCGEAMFFPPVQLAINTPSSEIPELKGADDE